MGWTYYDTTTLPRLHDIVWCRFPEDEPFEPGPKVRPALVRGVKIDSESNRGAVNVSYGTTNLKWMKRRKVDLIIQNAAALKEIGLPMATRFDLDHNNVLPWCAEFFCIPKGYRSITVGSLNAVASTRLNKLLQWRGIIPAEKKDE
jgi:hypothetical protein